MPKIEVIVLKVLIIGFALLGAVGIIIGLTRGDFTLCNFFGYLFYLPFVGVCVFRIKRF